MEQLLIYLRWAISRRRASVCEAPQFSSDDGFKQVRGAHLAEDGAQRRVVAEAKQCKSIYQLDYARLFAFVASLRCVAATSGWGERLFAIPGIPARAE